jgi:predicted Rossmann-fold nucleotide-binding protein
VAINSSPASRTVAVIGSARHSPPDPRCLPAEQVGGWTALTPNRWNQELIWSDTYPERLGHILSADAIVAVDGGIGTLSEAALAWSTLQTGPRG